MNSELAPGSGSGGGAECVDLLEREAEQQVLKRALSAAAAGDGGLVIVRGGAGSGKTALLEVAQRLAVARGMRVLSARGSQFEGSFAFGSARQLLSRAVAPVDAPPDVDLFAGSAALARPLFFAAGDGLHADTGGVAAGLVEGLSALIANLGTRDGAGVLVAVDDAHWCDRDSLRVLARSASGLDQLGVAIVIAVRSGEPEGDGDVITWLAADPRAEILEPAPLSLQAVHTLAERIFAGPVSAELAAACLRVTGGNPFLVWELLRGLHADGVAPSADAADRALTMVPDAVLRSVLARVAGLGPDARAMADAVAVLGDGASIHHAATLAGLTPAAGDLAADTLARAGLFSAGHPLQFAHPLLASAVTRELGAMTRARAHGRAARLLAAEADQQERVAAHLLHSPAAADPWPVGILREAAGESLRHGGPQGAVAMLRRALAEPPAPELHADVLLELAHAEAAAGDPIASDRLMSALDLVDDRDERVRALRELGRLQFAGEHHRDAAHTIQRALAELDEDDPLASELLVDYIVSAGLHETTRPELTVRIGKLAADADRGVLPTDRGLTIQLANALTVRRQPRKRAADLLKQALAAGPLDNVAPYGLAASWAVPALICAGELELAQTVAQQAQGAAARRGSVLHITNAAFVRALAAYQVGALAVAAREATVATQLAQSGFTQTLGWSAAILCNALTARGELDGAGRAMNVAARTDPGAVTHGMILHARARLALAREQPTRALADALAARDALTPYGLIDYPLAAWRLPGALAAHDLGQTEQAQALADEEVALSRLTGAPSQYGAALTARGRVAGEGEQIAILAEAVEVLEASAATLAYAEALYHLGAAHRRHGTRASAREPLLHALELAHQSGAQPLATQARKDLNLIGIRPRRTTRSGLHALTDSEREIVELAATGRTNRQIAAHLNLTTSTIESHLTRAYQKVGIRSRHQLAALLTPEPPAQPPDQSGGATSPR